jgi:hypothetical protein
VAGPANLTAGPEGRNLKSIVGDGGGKLGIHRRMWDGKVGSESANVV